MLILSFLNSKAVLLSLLLKDIQLTFRLIQIDKNLHFNSKTSSVRTCHTLLSESGNGGYPTAGQTKVLRKWGIEEDVHESLLDPFQFTKKRGRDLVMNPLAQGVFTTFLDSD